MQDDPELIEMRADERFDASRLEAWLRDRLPETGGDFALAQFGGGHANLTYQVSFGEHHYVLRRPPLGPVAPGAHDMAREHRVLEGLWRAFPLAPRSYLLCDDDAVIGGPFHVMERRPGIVIRRELPRGYDWTAELKARLGSMIVDVLARLHLADAAKAGLAALGRPEGFMERQLAGWSKRWHAAADDSAPDLARLIGWLERGCPRGAPAALMHNDYKLDNLLLDTADPARCVAVLDWDMCTRGDPLADLGYLLAFWGEPGDPQSWRMAASMPTWEPGFPSRDDAVEQYARATGFDCGDAHWYHLFGIFKIAVILQQIYIRFLRGQTQDQRFAVFGARVAALGEKARVLAKL